MWCEWVKSLCDVRSVSFNKKILIYFISNFPVSALQLKLFNKPMKDLKIKKSQRQDAVQREQNGVKSQMCQCVLGAGTQRGHCLIGGNVPALVLGLEFIGCNCTHLWLDTSRLPDILQSSPSPLMLSLACVSSTLKHPFIAQTLFGSHFFSWSFRPSVSSSDSCILLSGTSSLAASATLHALWGWRGPELSKNPQPHLLTLCLPWHMPSRCLWILWSERACSPRWRLGNLTCNLWVSSVEEAAKGKPSESRFSPASFSSPPWNSEAMGLPNPVIPAYQIPHPPWRKHCRDGTGAKRRMGLRGLGPSCLCSTGLWVLCGALRCSSFTLRWGTYHLPQAHAEHAQHGDGWEGGLLLRRHNCLISKGDVDGSLSHLAVMQLEWDKGARRCYTNSRWGRKGWAATPTALSPVVHRHWGFNPSCNPPGFQWGENWGSKRLDQVSNVTQR